VAHPLSETLLPLLGKNDLPLVVDPRRTPPRPLATAIPHLFAARPVAALHCPGTAGRSPPRLLAQTCGDTPVADRA